MGVEGIRKFILDRGNMASHSSEDLKDQLFQPLSKCWSLSRTGVLNLGLMSGMQVIRGFSEIISKTVCVCVNVYRLFLGDDQHILLAS